MEAIQRQQRLTLGNLCGGAVAEVFERELNEVLENILDPNTDPQLKRVITMEVRLKPYEDRTGADIEFSCRSRIAPVTSVRSRFYLTRVDGKPLAISNDPKQLTIFDAATAPVTEIRNVTPNPETPQTA